MIRGLVAFLMLNVLAPTGNAANDVAQREIKYLIGQVEHSGMRFIRNDKSYDGPAAANHLRMKWEKAGSKVKSAEDFILGIASRSLTSQTPYEIELEGGQRVPAGEWLKEELANYRAKQR